MFYLLQLNNIHELLISNYKSPYTLVWFLLTKNICFKNISIIIFYDTHETFIIVKHQCYKQIHADDEIY